MVLKQVLKVVSSLEDSLEIEKIKDLKEWLFLLGMTSCLEAPRLDLPTFVGPQIFRFVNSVSDGEDSASH